MSTNRKMVKWRGRLVFRVYNPQKPDKYGMKGYIVSERESGYCYNYDLYCGKSRRIQKICGGLLKDLYGFGYSLYG